MTFQATVEVDASVRAFASAVSRLSGVLRTAMQNAGLRHQRAMAERFVPYGSGDPIQTRSGALRRSFGFEVSGSGLETQVRLFSKGLPYARMQEYGGTIRPKNKRYLTIPLPDALTPAGVLKGGARLVPRGNRYETADGLPTFIFKSKRGNLLIGARAKNGETRLLYTLKPSVTLKARLGFAETFANVTRPALDAELARGVKAVTG